MKWDQPAAGRVRGWLGRRAHGQSNRQLTERKRAGEQYPAAVGRQVGAAVSAVDEYHQGTAMVAADLFAGGASLVSRHIHHDHVGRRPALGQLGR
jgi:hypothetical protein